MARRHPGARGAGGGLRSATARGRRRGRWCAPVHALQRRSGAGALRASRQRPGAGHLHAALPRARRLLGHRGTRRRAAARRARRRRQRGARAGGRLAAPPRPLHRAGRAARPGWCRRRPQQLRLRGDRQRQARPGPVHRRLHRQRQPRPESRPADGAGGREPRSVDAVRRLGRRHLRLPRRGRRPLDPQLGFCVVQPRTARWGVRLEPDRRPGAEGARARHARDAGAGRRLHPRQQPRPARVAAQRARQPPAAAHHGPAPAGAAAGAGALGALRRSHRAALPRRHHHLRGAERAEHVHHPGGLPRLPRQRLGGAEARRPCDHRGRVLHQPGPRPRRVRLPGRLPQGRRAAVLRRGQLPPLWRAPRLVDAALGDGDERARARLRRPGRRARQGAVEHRDVPRLQARRPGRGRQLPRPQACAARPWRGVG